MDRAIEDFVRGLHLDAYLVGGAVRDELLGRDSKDADFVVPGVDYEGLRAALEPHGKVDDLGGHRSILFVRAPLPVLLPSFWVVSTKPEAALDRSKAGLPC